MCHVDFMATVAAILGKKLPDHAAEDSVNVLPVLLGESHYGPTLSFNNDRPVVILSTLTPANCSTSAKTRLSVLTITLRSPS